ncbi:MAG: hypothetical protein HPKKFMNG_01633 [Planctomycetes bacterium]|nr:hypothetical protein [Planctomycetota bacterium]
MVLIAGNHAPEVLEPGVHALDLPAPFVAPQRAPVLGFAALFTVGRDEDDAARGTWQTDPHKGGTRYLWAGYRYQPPQMGFWVDPPGAAGLGVYGAATGTNRLDQYYCLNRIYDIATGRFTSPDPAATPFWNLFDYCHSQPTQLTDPTGLFVPITSPWGYLPRSDGPQLKMRTSFFNIGQCGQIAWSTNWELSEAAGSTSGSGMEKTWVVQIVARTESKGPCGGPETSSTIWYTEAWEVEPGQTKTAMWKRVKKMYDDKGRDGEKNAYDDMWQGGYNPKTHGSTTVSGWAFLMRGHQLPSFFKPDPTRSQGGMWGELHGAMGAYPPIVLLMMGGGSYASSMITRSLKVSWNCCDDAEKTGPTSVDSCTGVPLETEGKLKGGPKAGETVGHGCPPVESPKDGGK